MSTPFRFEHEMTTDELMAIIESDSPFPSDRYRRAMAHLEMMWRLDQYSPQRAYLIWQIIMGDAPPPVSPINGKGLYGMPNLTSWGRMQ